MDIKMPTYCCSNAVVYMKCTKCGKMICNKCYERHTKDSSVICRECAGKLSKVNEAPVPCRIKRVS